MTTEADIRLFTYGTLQRPEVQSQLFGRAVQCHRDCLAGYRVEPVELKDPVFATREGILQRTVQASGNPQDQVEGIVLLLTSDELQHVDSYEPAGYQRVQVTLVSGAEAWVYLYGRERADQPV